MGSVSHSRIKHADLVASGIVIAFEDGKCALFPSDLLYATLPQAKVLPELPADNEAPTREESPTLHDRKD